MSIIALPYYGVILVPNATLLGRSSSGEGPVECLDLAALEDMGIATKDDVLGIDPEGTLLLYRDNDNTLSQRNGTFPQSLKVASTHVNDNNRAGLLISTDSDISFFSETFGTGGPVKDIVFGSNDDLVIEEWARINADGLEISAINLNGYDVETSYAMLSGADFTGEVSIASNPLTLDDGSGNVAKLVKDGTTDGALKLVKADGVTLGSLAVGGVASVLGFKGDGSTTEDLIIADWGQSQSGGHKRITVSNANTNPATVGRMDLKFTDAIGYGVSLVANWAVVSGSWGIANHIGSGAMWGVTSVVGCQPSEFRIGAAHSVDTNAVRLWKAAPNTLAQRNGTNPQTSSLYATYDGVNDIYLQTSATTSAMTLAAVGTGTYSSDNIDIVLTPTGSGAVKVVKADGTTPGKLISDEPKTIAVSFAATGQSTPLSIPYGLTIQSWRIVAPNVSGTIEFDVWADSGAIPTASESIVASAPPTTTNEVDDSSTLTGWTTALADGDIVIVDCVDLGGADSATLQLICVRV